MKGRHVDLVQLITGEPVIEGVVRRLAVKLLQRRLRVGRLRRQIDAGRPLPHRADFPHKGERGERFEPGTIGLHRETVQPFGTGTYLAGDLFDGADVRRVEWKIPLSPDVSRFGAPPLRPVRDFFRRPLCRLIPFIGEENPHGQFAYVFRAFQSRGERGDQLVRGGSTPFGEGGTPRQEEQGKGSTGGSESSVPFCHLSISDERRLRLIE